MIYVKKEFFFSLENNNLTFWFYSQYFVHSSMEKPKIFNEKVIFNKSNKIYLMIESSFSMLNSIPYKNENCVIVRLVSTSGSKVEIIIEEDKTVEELIKLYFEL